MQRSGWQTAPPSLADDQALVDALVALHRRLNERHFLHDPMSNQALGIQARACRRVDGWRAVLLLTPWMLSRLLLPERDPGLALPAGWEAGRRAGAGYQVLGPGMEIVLLGQPQRAHLNFDATLGHYLLQPLVLNMAPYASAEAVFQAWNRVIETRDRNMERARRDCPWQREISRRELFHGPDLG